MVLGAGFSSGAGTGTTHGEVSRKRKGIYWPSQGVHLPGAPGSTQRAAFIIKPKTGTANRTHCLVLFLSGDDSFAAQYAPLDQTGEDHCRATVGVSAQW